MMYFLAMLKPQHRTHRLYAVQSVLLWFGLVWFRAPQFRGLLNTTIFSQALSYFFCVRGCAVTGCYTSCKAWADNCGLRRGSGGRKII
ncbi:hypothetical protein ACQJBY_012127 [Aegilops geniculata]